LAFAATAPAIGAARFRSAARSTFTSSRSPDSGSPTVSVAPSVPPGAGTGAGAGSVVSAGSPDWSMVLSCGAFATASPVIPWSMITPWSASACALEPTERTLAATAASIGAATLALAATARSMGAAASRARSTSALRSSKEMTSLSGRAAPVSAASSSGESGRSASSWATAPPSPERALRTATEGR
jgi:hypothetical protein